MDNANSPAMPITNEAMASAVMSERATAMLLMGLTKREQIAAMAMQAFLGKGSYDKWEHVAEDAINVADALLLALSAGKEKAE